MSLTLLEPGMLTSVQDLGRFGFRNLGFSTNGAMDTLAAKTANLILDNPESAPVLEYTLTGPTLKFHEPAAICLTGGNPVATLDNQPVDSHTVISIQSGQILKIGSLRSGCRGYLAIKGGFQLRETLGSCSTYLRAGIGGLEGRALKENDQLKFTPMSSQESLKHEVSLGLEFTHYLEEPKSTLPVRFVRGPQFSWFSKQGLETFLNQPYSVRPDSDRMGYRLSGEKIVSQHSESLITEGATSGAIQIPPDGQPIILMSDCQPTGGYPKMGNIISVDLPRVAQLKPSDTLIFQEVSIEEAQQELIEQRFSLNRLSIAAKHYWKRIQDEYQ
ncbi:biotin-dependent carboxyltransferase family protein [Endozoicomonas arenosclerae]|uniref:5-oxoprolinase subunit C family protein n=1 Tax=Endozoicomonas arenosclerae TaxID=1633495 RepID=UPI00078474AD|nr:biotin-dependent carboxyltransferase family protein [Endozoicomonas arenosclerae]